MKRDHLTNRALATEDRDDAIEAEGDATVRRRAVFERFEEKPESRLRLFIRDLQQLEDQALQRLVVNSDAATRNLASVQHEIVRARAGAPRIAFEKPGVALERRRKRVVHELVALFLFDPLEHRKVDNP